MGWERARRRYRLAHDVADDLAQGGRIAAWRPTIEAEYGDLAAFLCDVQRRYHRAVEARLDALLEVPPADPEASVAAILDEVAGVYPALRLLLEEHADLPAVAEGEARFRRIVHAATGVDLDVRHEARRCTTGDRGPACRPGRTWLQPASRP